MQACDYFADEARLHSLCCALAHRLLSPPDEHADTVLSPNEVLSNLSEGVARRVLRCTPPDRLDHALAVLAKAWHPEIVRACFPSIYTQSTLVLDCSCVQHPHTTLSRVLQALCSMPPLHSLELIKLRPMDDDGAPPEPLLHALQQACKAPKQVSLVFTDVQMCDPVLADFMAALRENTALQSLSISKQVHCFRGQGNRMEDVLQLSGIEVMTGLESLTLSLYGDHPEQGHYHFQQQVVQHVSLASLTNLTALRFTHERLHSYYDDHRLRGVKLQNSRELACVLPALQSLRELALSAQLQEIAPRGWSDSDSDSEFEVPSGDAQTAIMHAASRLPQLSQLVLGGDDRPWSHDNSWSRRGQWRGDVLGKLSRFPALRRCKLDGVNLCKMHGASFDEVPAHVLALACALRNMPHLESLQLYVFVTTVTTGLLPVLDALEAAGTSHSCTALSVEYERSEYFGHVPQVRHQQCPPQAWVWKN